MERSIAAFEARRQFGKMLRDVAVRGDRFLVERHGEAVAAVVPIEVYRQWKQARDEHFDKLFATMQVASERANLSPEQADALALEAVAAVRAKRSE